jgi:hypothetical protein
VNSRKLVTHSFFQQQVVHLEPVGNNSPSRTVPSRSIRADRVLLLCFAAMQLLLELRILSFESPSALRLAMSSTDQVQPHCRVAFHTRNQFAQALHLKEYLFVDVADFSSLAACSANGTRVRYSG